MYKGKETRKTKRMQKTQKININTKTENCMQIDEQTETERLTDRRIDGMDGWMDGQIFREEEGEKLLTCQYERRSNFSHYHSYF